MTELISSSSEVDVEVAELDLCVSLALLVLDLAGRALAESFWVRPVAPALSGSLFFVDIASIPTHNLARRSVPLAQLFVLRLHVLVLAAGEQQAEHEHGKDRRQHLHEEVQERVGLDAVHHRALHLEVGLAYILVRLVLVDTHNFISQVALLEPVVWHEVKDTLFARFALSVDRDEAI